jgi:hypothetical protein
MVFPDVPLLLSTTSLIVALVLPHVDVASVYVYVPSRKYTVSPADAAVCARDHVANGAVSDPAAVSLPVGDTYHVAA